MRMGNPITIEEKFMSLQIMTIPVQIFIKHANLTRSMLVKLQMKYVDLKQDLSPMISILGRVFRLGIEILKWIISVIMTWSLPLRISEQGVQSELNMLDQGRN